VRLVLAGFTIAFCVAMMLMIVLNARAQRTVWDRLAECESGGRWRYNGSSGFDGGLQFHPSTWRSFKPRRYPRYAWQAPRWKQIVVAKRVLRVQGWNAWPACSLRLGLR